MMIKRSVISLIISIGFLFSSLAVAADSASTTTEQPTAQQVNKINMKLFEDLSQQVFYRLRDVCEGEYICQCLKKRNQDVQRSLGDDYLIVKMVCQNASK